MEIKPKFDMTQDTPQEGDGGTHKDGVLGLYPKGSPSEQQERLAAKLLNEYERVMRLLAKGLGDPDFTGTWQGVGITNTADGIRKLKQELDLLANKVANIDTGNGGGGGAGGTANDIGTGIIVDFISDGDETTNEKIYIQDNIYTPQVAHVKYQPSYEVVSVEDRTVTLLGGKITTEKGIVGTIRTDLTHRGYEFPIDELLYLPNVDFAFGVGTSLPANEFNRVEVIDGAFALPTSAQSIFYKGQKVATATNELGAGMKTFTYTDINGNNPKEVCMVLVAGTVVNGFIDKTQVFNAYLAGRYPEYQTFTNYKVLFDARRNHGSVDTATVTNGTYYVYYMSPITQYYAIGVDKATGQLKKTEFVVTSKGTPLIDSGIFPLYFIIVQFDKDLHSNTIVPELCSFRVHSRYGHSAESSVRHYFIKDSLIDVREFKKRKVPVLSPAVSLVNLDVSKERIVQTDFNGVRSKVVPLFFSDAYSPSGELTTGYLIPYGEAYAKGTRSQLSLLLDGSLSGAFAGSMININRMMRIAAGLDGLDLRLLHVLTNIVAQKYNGSNWANYNDSSDLISQDNTLFEVVVYENKSILARAEFTRRQSSRSWEWTWDPLYGTDIPVSDPLKIEIWIRNVTNPQAGNVNGSVRYYCQSPITAVYSPLYTKMFTTIAGQRAQYTNDWHAVSTDFMVDRCRFEVSGGKLNLISGRLIKTTDVLEGRMYATVNENSIDGYITSLDNSAPQWSTYETAMTATLPLMRASVNSLINQYLAVLDANGSDVYLYAIHKQDARRVKEVKINMGLGVGDSIPVNNPVNGIYAPSLIVQCEVPDRPKVIVPVLNGTTLSVTAVTFPMGIYGNQIVEVVKEIDVTGLNFLGMYRTYEFDVQRNDPPIDVDILDGLQLFFYDTADDTLKLHVMCPRRRTPTNGYIMSAEWYLNIASDGGFALDTWHPGRDYYMRFNILKGRTVPSSIMPLFVLNNRYTVTVGRDIKPAVAGAFALYLGSTGERMMLRYANIENSVYASQTSLQDNQAVVVTDVEFTSFATANLAGFIQKDGIQYIDNTTPSSPALKILNPFTGTIN